MLIAAMMKVGIIYILIILLGMCSAGAVEANNVNSNWDWLSTPIYSYGYYNSPYIHTYYYPFFDNTPPFYSHSPAYSDRFLDYVPSLLLQWTSVDLCLFAGFWVEVSG